MKVYYIFIIKNAWCILSRSKSYRGIVVFKFKELTYNPVNFNGGGFFMLKNKILRRKKFMNKFEIFYLNGTVGEINQTFLSNYIKLHKSEIYAYKRIQA